MHFIFLSSTVENFSCHLSKLTGPETKELFSMAGLMTVKEYFKWTNDDAVDRYNADLQIQYALNIDQGAEISRATYFRYQKLFREEDNGREVMRLITDELLKKANIDLSEQRLDSTHVFSDMATFSRRRLMHHTIYAFLMQLKRHHDKRYRELPEDFLARYTSDDGWCFAENSPMLTLHYGNTKATPEEQLGYDMRRLIERCPTGKRPMKSRFNHDTQKGYAIFFKDVCGKCPNKANCPVQKYGKNNYKWEYDAVKLRLRDRRLYERTQEFHDKYAPRNGIEGLNGNLKQNTLLRRLRCRGKTAVYTAIYLIAAMYNVMQYARYCRKTGKNLNTGTIRGTLCRFGAVLTQIFTFSRRYRLIFKLYSDFSGREKLLTA
jgi:hypothetical protein